MGGTFSIQAQISEFLELRTWKSERWQVFRLVQACYGHEEVRRGPQKNKHVEAYERNARDNMRTELTLGNVDLGGRLPEKLLSAIALPISVSLLP